MESRGKLSIEGTLYSSLWPELSMRRTVDKRQKGYAYSCSFRYYNKSSNMSSRQWEHSIQIFKHVGDPNRLVFQIKLLSMLRRTGGLQDNRGREPWKCNEELSAKYNSTWNRKKGTVLRARLWWKICDFLILKARKVLTYKGLRRKCHVLRYRDKIKNRLRLASEIVNGTGDLILQIILNC